MQEVTTKVELIAVQSRLRVRESANASAAKVKRSLDLNVLRLHRKYLFRALFEEAEGCFLNFEFHVLPALLEVLFYAPVAKRIHQLLFHILFLYGYIRA